MELSIQKYCAITPRKVSVNGEKIIDVDIQESLEKSLVQTYRNLGFDYLKFFKMDNLSKLAILAAENVLKGTDLYSKTCNDNVAIVLANASSSLVADTNFQHTISDPENYFPSPSLFVYTLPNISIGEICIKYKIFGSNMFFINQKFDASTLYFYVNELFENASTDYCITGWVECNENAYEAFLLLVTKGLSQYKFDINTIDFLYKINK